MISCHKIDSLWRNQFVQRRREFLELPVGSVEKIAGNQNHRWIFRVDLAHDALRNPVRKTLPK